MRTFLETARCSVIFFVLASVKMISKIWTFLSVKKKLFFALLDVVDMKLSTPNGYFPGKFPGVRSCSINGRFDNLSRMMKKKMKINI